MAQNLKPIGVPNEVDTNEDNSSSSSNSGKDSSANDVVVAGRSSTRPTSSTSFTTPRNNSITCNSSGGGGQGGKHSVSKRLQQELLTLMTSGDKGISAFPDSDYMFKWTGTIHGPAETVYEGLVYKLSLEFPSGYPYAPPTVRFITHCFHPNVDQQSGIICLDILKEKWSALYDVRAILLSIQSLLGEPNNDSPLNPQAAELWSNPEAYKRKLHEKTSATPTTTTTTKA